MEDFLRKIVGSIFVFATVLSGFALVVVMLNYDKINSGAPTQVEAKAAGHEAEEAGGLEEAEEAEEPEEPEEPEKPKEPEKLVSEGEEMEELPPEEAEESETRAEGTE